MTFDEIKQLIQMVLDTGVAELEVARGDDRVRIRRTAEAPIHEVVISGQAGATHAHTGNPGHGSTPAHVPAAPPAEQLEYVKSPIVGTFYEAPSPDAAPFVRIGDRVTPGQVLCIIESMKLMNEIESEISGTVVHKLIENARPVEYGEALFAIRQE